VDEKQLSLDYLAPVPPPPMRRPRWLNMTYLVVGGILVGFALACLLGQVDLFRWLEHWELYGEWIGVPLLLITGLVLMTKGLELFEESSNQR
jgi:hypothetical protein